MLPITSKTPSGCRGPWCYVLHSYWVASFSNVDALGELAKCLESPRRTLLVFSFWLLGEGFTRVEVQAPIWAVGMSGGCGQRCSHWGTSFSDLLTSYRSRPQVNFFCQHAEICCRYVTSEAWDNILRDLWENWKQELTIRSNYNTLLNITLCNKSAQVCCHSKLNCTTQCRLQGKLMSASN